jgi:hypothetical protein
MYYFAQQHQETVAFFENLSKSKTYYDVSMDETPHYELIKNQNEKLYIEYLKNSWKFYYNNVDDHQIFQQIHKFKLLINNICKYERNLVPIHITVTPTGRKLIIDGNHRYTTVLALNLHLNVLEFPLEYFLRKYLKYDKTFYKSKDVTSFSLQSIIFQNNVLLHGQHTDIYDRVDVIQLKDIQNLKIIDFNCYSGIFLHALIERGAQRAIGLTYNKHITMAAIRLNNIFMSPVHFVNLKKLTQSFKLKNKFHTGFIFSIDNYINQKSLILNIQNNISSVIYFDHVLTYKLPTDLKALFSKIEPLGIFENKLFFRGELKND